MPKSKATSVDVARAAGVSQSSVSRAFTPGLRVKPDIKERIEKAARDLGYSPNKIARAMIKGRSYAIGVVVASLDNPFYADAIDRLSQELKPLGYHILLFSAGNDERNVGDVVQELVNHQVEGIVLVSVSMTLSLTKRIEDTGIPCVLFNRGQAHGPLPMVTAGNYMGGQRAARFLIRTGHKRIAHISGWLGAQTGIDRKDGFLDVMKEHPDLLFGISDSDYKRDTAMRVTREMFDSGSGPDAIFVGNDFMAFAVMEALRHDLGLRVPEDVSVMGFDDVPMSAWRDFDLTTFRQPVSRMVTQTVNMLSNLINGSEIEESRIVLESALIERGSTMNRLDGPS